ncbi:hypothetical protein [uncultured Thiothrix sp.]|uniref:hypothetical protein n=1 Tax=uncultured Thiothrix sp. TaxID=223185 RepID=UPI00261DB2D8|nr:hypothetical protein [uncultured Thiothrix sp.]
MEISTQQQALNVLVNAWQLIIEECSAVLGSELHYQAMIYHSLRHTGVPNKQLGMNVKMRINNPVSALFQRLDQKKNPSYQGGFEPIPDICIFSPPIAGDWRRRNYSQTLTSLLLVIEVKASERHKGRLSYQEIAFDIEKLAAHRVEASHRGNEFIPVMLIIDSAPDPHERMKQETLDVIRIKAHKEAIGLLYYSPDLIVNTLSDIFITPSTP